MRLYYFTTAEHGLMAIQDRRLKLAKLNELNDPFEFLGIALSNPEKRKKWRNWKQQMATYFGIVCMTEKFDNALMWSHYAKSHTGLCLGFDVETDGSEPIAKKITYRKDKFTESELGLPPSGEPDECHMEAVLHSKHEIWQYEDEWRLWNQFETPSIAGILEFIEFSPKLILRQIIIGAGSSVTRQQIFKTIGTLDTIEEKGIFKMRPAFKNFNIVKNRDGKLWK